MSESGCQKSFIQAYRKKKFGLDEAGSSSSLPEDLLNDLNNSIETLSKDLYSDDVHFIFELIQNAQDNSYAEDVVPTLIFRLLSEDPTGTDDANGCLCVFNNEVGFSQENIKSICSVGGSTKKDKKIEGFIGEKGIGFKSVFKVSASPHIISNGYQIYFNENDTESGINFITPHWVDNLPEQILDKSDYTCILLPLKPSKYSYLKDSLVEHRPERGAEPVT